MIRVFAILLLPLLLVASPHRSNARRPGRKASPYAAGPLSTIHDVSVVDVVRGQITPHQDILIRGGVISDVKAARKQSKGERFVIPGLWDMHVHLWYADPQFRLFLANGVTGVRDMGSDLSRIRKWKSDIEKGELIGPGIYASGIPLSTAPEPKDSRLQVKVIATAVQARKEFNRQYDEGVDFIKVLDLSEPAFEALAELSRHNGLPFTGHVPDSVSAFEAAEDRMVSMEHLFGIGLACSSKEHEIRAALLNVDAPPDRDARHALTSEILDTYDPATAAKLWERFRHYEIRQTPTLTLWSRISGGHSGASAQDPEFRYVNASVRRQWKAEEVSALDKRMFESALALTAAMSKAGVPILAGTDTGDPWTVPGATLHDELELLVKAGLTPAQALRSATSEPALLMQRGLTLGQVKKGFTADLVVLDANPLKDIRNTRRIENVVVRGKLLEKHAIQRMLSETAATAATT